MDIRLSWTPSDAAGVNEFLQSTLGKKWLEYLAKRKPPLDLSSTERAALSGALAAGYEKAFAEMNASREAIMHDPSGLRGIDPTKD